MSNALETNFCFSLSDTGWQRPLALSESFANAALKLSYLLSPVITALWDYFFLQMESMGLDSVYLPSAIIPQIQNGFSLERAWPQTAHWRPQLYCFSVRKKITSSFFEGYYIMNREH